MSDGKKYYCFCSSNCKYETMTKEQIIAAIMQATESGEIHDVDAGFITKVKENNAGGYVTFWTGTQAQFNALPSIDPNCLYIFTDDTLKEDIATAVQQAVSTADAALQEAGAAKSFAEEARTTAENAQTRAASAEAIAAYARNSAADAFTKAQGMEAVDITNEITLTPSCEAVTLSVLTITQKKFVYDPNVGVVHFSFTIKTGNTQDTTLPADRAISVDQTGGYTSKAGYVNRIFDSRDWFNAKVNQYKYTLTAKEDISGFTKNGIETTICGWYFCDGKG